MRWFLISIHKEEFDKLDITFHLDEIEAKIYGFLEQNVNKAFSMFEIYINAFVDEMFRKDLRKLYCDEDYIDHPLYQTIQKKGEKMVKEGKIAGKYHQGKYYYTV